VDQFADRAHRAAPSLGVHDQDLGPGDRPPDRAGLAVQTLGRQIGAAEGLGQAVHEHERGPWVARAQLANRALGQAATAVGHHAQLRQRLAAEAFHLQQLQPERRHRGHHGGARLAQRPDDPGGHGRALDHQLGADRGRAQQLVQPVVEVQRQQRGDAVLGPQTEVLHDGGDAGPEVAVRKRDSLGPAGRARGVDDLRHVVGDAGHGSEVAGAGQRVEGDHAGAAAQRSREALEDRAVGQQQAGPGVLEHVLDLARAQALVDQHGDRPGAQRPEEGSRGAGAARGQYRHSLTGREPGRGQGLRHA